MSFKNMPNLTLILESVDCARIQQLINDQRAKHPADGHLQIVMDRQQARLDKRVAEFEADLAEVVLNN